jgi:hypothetical protein
MLLDKNTEDVKQEWLFTAVCAIISGAAETPDMECHYAFLGILNTNKPLWSSPILVSEVW